MSAEATAVGPEHFRYIAEHTRADDSFLAGLKQAAREAGLPEIWISPEQAGFLCVVLKLCGARTVIDVGTLAGYSAIAMARALPPDGHVHTIEVSGRHADFAEAWLGRSDVADRITLYRGQAHQVLPRFADGSADAIFIDADKRRYPQYLEEAMRILRPGGALLVDNAFAFGKLFAEQPGDPDVPLLRQFNDLLAGRTDLDAIIVPLGDGCWLGVKRA